MKPFRERNPVPLGLISLIVIFALVFIALNLKRFPIVTRETSYSAQFPEAAGIAKDNEVRIAGVRKGTVTDVRLDGASVVVRFRLDRKIKLGDQTRAAVKLKTLLGTKFLDIQPDGGGKLKPGSRIPMERTEVPFQIYEAFDQLTGAVQQIDTKALGQALKVLADTFADPDNNAQAALKGLATLSGAVASRDDDLRRLLASTRSVTAALASRDAEVTKLIADTDLLLVVVKDRRAAIASLLDNTARLADELTSLVRDNRAKLDPLLRDLHSVVEVLRAHLADLDRSVLLLGPFARQAANTTGNGRWLDVYSENLVVTDEILCALGAC